MTTPQLDVEQLRSDTPGCAHVTHFNNAGASLQPHQVIDSVIEFVRLESEIGGYEAQDQWSEQLDQVYDGAASFLNCNRDSLALTSSGSEAWWRAFTSVPLEPGDRVVTSRSEFVSAAAGLLAARERGVEVVDVASLPDGTLDLDAFAEAVDARTRLVCLTHVPMTQGVVNPVAEATTIAHGVDALVLVDGTQAVGQTPVDLTAIGCDLYAITGRKWLRAPRGTGMLFANPVVYDRLLPPLFVDGRSGSWTEDGYSPAETALRFEQGERSISAAAGLGAALQVANGLGIDAIADRVSELGMVVRSRLADVDGVTVHDGSAASVGIIGITVAGRPNADVVQRLRQAGINTAAPGSATSLHDLHDRGLDGIVRVAPHYFNTVEEIDHLARALDSL